MAALAVYGLLCGYQLPVSLFPNSSKPEIYVHVSYGNLSSEEFLNSYGRTLEELLRNLQSEKVRVEKVRAKYRRQNVAYVVSFQWGNAPTLALRETEVAINSFSARFPLEIRDSIHINFNAENSGFFALSFFSQKRSLDELYRLLDPLLTPKLAAVQDANNPVLWNPASKEIRIEMDPYLISSLQILPRDVETSLQAQLGGRNAGSLTLHKGPTPLELPRQIQEIHQIGEIPVLTPTGKVVHLSEFASVDWGPKSSANQKFKTSGAPSLILFATPKPGGNVKRMSEDMTQLVQSLSASLPKDVEYRTLVDPSEFIGSAIKNVYREVSLAAFLAVLVLFVFIGSFRNVITAAIEIPLSMILAFILMKYFGLNVNLISLGGLALSAGMNVDASVVVIENIFRHFEHSPGPHSFTERLKILVAAVREVEFPILASTLASLVVFLPLVFTTGISNAILSDLALAVVFSHGFSAVVALVLVPTIRLQMMSLEKGPQAPSFFEPYLKKLEAGYSSALSFFLNRPSLQWGTYAFLVTLLVCLVSLVAPRLPREIVGKPDTDWLILGLHTEGNASAAQMESLAEVEEAKLLKEYGKSILYTFTQINGPNSATLMSRLKDKNQMKPLWKSLEKSFVNTPTMTFWVAPWNPSEMEIPDPPDFKLTIFGGSAVQRAQYADGLSQLLQEQKVFPTIQTSPDASKDKIIKLRPHTEQWSQMKGPGAFFTPGDLADVLRIATVGRRAALFPMDNQLTEVVFRFPKSEVETVEDIESFPLSVAGKLIPLKSMATVSLLDDTPAVFRKNGQPYFELTGRQERGNEALAASSAEKARSLVTDWVAGQTQVKSDADTQPQIVFDDPADELTDALRQLTKATAISVGLMFMILLMQFGSIVESLLIMVAIPLGIAGVVLSLFIFKSTLSLNSLLGVILLNGISVGNSILLVDFIRRRKAEGLTAKLAAIEGSVARLRPILITSLTTILGMLPIALGFGEGGNILQPLGIAVSGGMGFSMMWTLFIVPALYFNYLKEPQRPQLRVGIRERVAKRLEFLKGLRRPAPFSNPIEPFIQEPT